MARARSPKVPPVLHELEAEIMEEIWRQEEPNVMTAPSVPAASSQFTIGM